MVSRILITLRDIPPDSANIESNPLVHFPRLVVLVNISNDRDEGDGDNDDDDRDGDNG